MATNKTSFLNMNDWVGTDPFKREEINANFRTLDAKAKEHDDELVQKADKSEVATLTTQLAEKAQQSDLVTTNNTVALKADKSYVDTQVQAMASGSPKGVYATISALQTAFPTGNTNTYLVTADGKWYYWNGSAWTAGGVYQGTTPADKSVGRTQLADYFSLGANIASGVSLNTINTEGTFTGVANGGYLNMPNDLSTTVPFILRVYPSSLGTNRFLVQHIIETDNPNKQYFRQIDKTGTYSYNWVSLIPDKSITRAKLEDRFSLNSDIATGTNLNSLTLEGTYTGSANSGCLNLPVCFNATAAFVLYVTPTYKSGGSANRFYIQRLVKFDVPNEQYIRRLDTANQYTTEWTNITNTPLSRLSGKKVVFFGDSFIELGDYPDRIAAKLGISAISVGFGGCRMARYGTSGLGAVYDKFSMYNLARYINTGNYSELDQAVLDAISQNNDDNSAAANRLKSTDFNTVDYIVIAFGTNDYGGDTPLGTDADADGTTFKGAINYTIEKILSAYPHIRILFVSPFWRARFSNATDGLDSDTYRNAAGNLLVDYVDAIKTRANANHLPALDMFREGGINKFNYSYWLSDGLHPKTGLGYEHVANKIAAGMTSKF